MQKIYLLLRNNQQTGPFSIDELLQHSLKNDDLIWVEDQSAGWSYPSEIESLKPFIQQASVSETKGFKKVGNSSNQSKTSSSNQQDLNKNKSSKHIFIKLPEGRNMKNAVAEKQVTDLEQKAAALREKVLSFSSGKNGVEETDDVQTKYSRTLSDVEAEYTSWVYKKKINSKQHAAKKQLAYIVVALFSLAVVFFVVKSFINNEGEETSIVERTAEENAASENSINEDSIYNYANVFKGKSNADNNYDSFKQFTLKATIEGNDNLATHNKGVSKQVQNSTENKGTDNNVVEVKPGLPEAENATTDTTGIKKSISQKIKGIFEKINIGKEKDATNSEPESKEVVATPKTEVKDLYKNVVLSSNQTTVNNWMLGIKGLKITLQNKGSETIKEASVSVRYFNEEKELMETKVIHFANVEGRKKATVAAPDHRLASFTDFVLLSASN